MKPRGGKLHPPTLVAAAVTLAISAYLLRAYAAGAIDGWVAKGEGELLALAPDLLEPDPARARRIPDFTLPDRHGNRVSLSQFAAARVVVVNIWASTCPVCEEEIPALSEMDRRLPSVGPVALLTITTDSRFEEVARFFPRGTDLRVLFDPEEKVTKGIFGTTKFPETFVLDAERRVRARFDGQRDWYAPPMLDFLRSFL